MKFGIAIFGHRICESLKCIYKCLVLHFMPIKHTFIQERKGHFSKTTTFLICNDSSNISGSKGKENSWVFEFRNIKITLSRNPLNE